MREWDEVGLDPAFAHQAQWITDVLDRVGSPEVAAYALPAESRGDLADGASRRARRFLVVTDLALVEAQFALVGGEPALSVRLVPWPVVRGLELTAETTVDESFRHRASYVLRLAEPGVEIREPVDDRALLELWRECVLRVGRPPDERPKRAE